MFGDEGRGGCWGKGGGGVACLGAAVFVFLASRRRLFSLSFYILFCIFLVLYLLCVGGFLRNILVYSDFFFISLAASLVSTALPVSRQSLALVVTVASERLMERKSWESNTDAEHVVSHSC